MTNAIVQFDFNELSRIAKAMAASGFFQDTKLEAQAIVKVLAGREMGLGPFASMTGIHIIQGRPSLGANLIASLIKNDPRYNYRVVQLDDKVCSVDFYENGEKCGNSTFTAEDARKAQTKNLDKFPKNMLFARAISNGAKWFTPGIFGGSPVYTPDELGADVDEDGNIIEGAFTPAPAPEKKPITPRNEQNQVVSNPPVMTLEAAKLETSSDGEFYWNTHSEDLAHKTIGITKMLKKNDLPAEKRTEYQRKFDAIGVILKYRRDAELAEALDEQGEEMDARDGMPYGDK